MLLEPHKKILKDVNFDKLTSATSKHKSHLDSTNEIMKFLNNFYWILNQIIEMETDYHSNIPLCGFSSQNFTIFYEILVQNFKYGNFDLIYPSDEFATRTLKYWNNMKNHEKSLKFWKNFLKESEWNLNPNS